MSKKTKSKRKRRPAVVIRVSDFERRVDKHYWRDLSEALDLIFSRAANDMGWEWSELAGAASLCYETVRRLGQRETRFPRFQTVYKLASAVGVSRMFVFQWRACPAYVSWKPSANWSSWALPMC